MFALLEIARIYKALKLFAHPHQEFPVVPPSGDQEQAVNHVIIIIA